MILSSSQSIIVSFADPPSIKVRIPKSLHLQGNAYRFADFSGVSIRFRRELDALFGLALAGR